MTHNNSKCTPVDLLRLVAKAIIFILAAMVTLLTVSAGIIYGYETEVRGPALNELHKLIPQDILEKCNVARAKDMEYLRRNMESDPLSDPDTSHWSSQYLARVMDARYLHIYNRSYILSIVGCSENLAILLMDSVGHHDIIFRLTPNIKLYSGYFFDLVYPFEDINADSIPDMAVELSWGGIGSEMRFLSVAPDSLYFLKTEDGHDSFGHMRGELKLLDLDEDGIMEIYTHEYDIYDKIDYCNLYKWDGEKYTLISTLKPAKKMPGWKFLFTT